MKAAQFAGRRQVDGPAIQLRQLPRDCQAESIAWNRLVGAPPRQKDLRDLVRRDAGAIVVDRDPRRAPFRGCDDPDGTARPFAGIVEDGSEKFVQVLLVDGEPKVVGTGDDDVEPSIRIKFAQDLAEIPQAGSQGGERRHPSRFRGAGPVQVMAEAALHRVDELQELAASDVPVLLQLEGERCERRLEAVRKVGNLPTGADQVLAALHDQPVELLDQRPELERLRIVD